MINEPTCCGCFTYSPTVWVDWREPPNPFMQTAQSSFINVVTNGLTPEEKDCLAHIANAYESFCKIGQFEDYHIDDSNDFKKCIHDLQRIIGTRVARRMDVDIWK